MRAKAAEAMRRRSRRVRDGLGARLASRAEDLLTLQRPVVLIAGPAIADSLPGWRARFQYRLHVVTSPSDDAVQLDVEGIDGLASDSIEDIAGYVAEIGPVAAIIDERAGGLEDELERWQKCFFHVTANGSYIVVDDETSGVWGAAVEDIDSERATGTEARQLSSAIASTWVADGIAVTEKNRDHLFKVKDQDALTILPSRLGAQNVRVLGSVGSRPAGEGLIVQSFGTLSDHRIPARKMQAPELKLLEFRGRTDLRADMLAVNGATVLPSSFKHPWRAWNDQLVNVDEKVAALKEREGSTIDLEGSFYDLTAAVPGHRGHFLTTSLPKLWGWHEAKQRDQHLRAFYRTASNDPDAPFQRAVLEAYGIEGTDIHFDHRDVSVQRFVTASQAWQNGGRHFAHPVNRAIWDDIRHSLEDVASPGPEKVFVTRSSTVDETPGPRNARAVEEHFAAHGFVVVDLDDAPWMQVAHVLAGAETVAGFAGSGLYPMFLSERVQRVIVLTHEANTGRNEHLFAALLAREIDYLWSAPDVAQPARGFSSAAFNSQWEFDFDANADGLTALLG